MRQLKQSTANGLKKLSNEINDIVEQTFYFEQRQFELSQKIDRNKEKILAFMKDKQTLNAVLDNGNLVFTAKKKVIPDIEFDVDKLQEVLDKKTYKEMVDRDFGIKDMKGLIDLLKAHDVSPKDFKKHIVANDTVNTEKLDTMLEIGDIELDQLQGCYTAQFEELLNIKKVK